MKLGSLEMPKTNLASREWLAKQTDCSVYITWIRGESDGEPDNVPFKSGKVYSIYDLCKFLENDQTCYAELSAVGDGATEYDIAAAEPGNVFFPMGFVLVKNNAGDVG